MVDTVAQPTTVQTQPTKDTPPLQPINPAARYQVSAAGKMMTIEVSVFAKQVGFDFLAAPGCIPYGTWTVVWELLDPEGLRVFAGIDIDPADLPATTSLDVPPTRSSDTEWTAQITNRISGLSAANMFSYYISVAERNDSNKRVKKDPTIAVVKDPMDPP